MVSLKDDVTKEFPNPNFKPLEDLKVTLLQPNCLVAKEYPAICKEWISSRVFVNYCKPPKKNESGEYPLGAKEDWLQRCQYLSSDLKHLLIINMSRFWSNILYNEVALRPVKTFILTSSNMYDESEHPPMDSDIKIVFREIYRLVFLVLYRLTVPKLSETQWIREETLGQYLYDNYIITMPFLLDVSLLYGKENNIIINQFISNIFRYQPKYLEDLKVMAEFIIKVFQTAENQLNCAGANKQEPVKLTERQNVLTIPSLSKVVNCLLDTIYSATSFLDVYEPAATIFHELQFEIKVADLYEYTIPSLWRQIKSLCNNEESMETYFNLNFKIDVTRFKLLKSVNMLLSSQVNKILQLRDKIDEVELKKVADEYTTLLSELVANKLFMEDYNNYYPVESQLDIIAQVCPEMDVSDFLIESVRLCSNKEIKKERSNDLRRNYHPVLDSSPSTSQENENQASNHIAIPKKTKIVTGVELESLISEVKDILSHLGEGFIQKCLEHFNFESAAVINAILENLLPDNLASLDPTMPYVPPILNEEASNALPERVNVFDNDEFDIMNRDDVDTTNMHIGKRKQKHKNLIQLINDKSHVDEMRDMYTKLNIVEYDEEQMYNDEYDDTYDEAAMVAGDEGDTERRPFTIPRVLQRRISIAEENDDSDEVEESEDKNKPKFEYFVANPEEVRAKAEQWRRDHQRGGGRGGRGKQRDVVGKPKGQGQEKEVLQNREYKNTNKSRSANHNRRAMASRKRNQGMMPF
uniref:CUE domain-containing protein n=1 Tax=Clastoptera arizonana TaxID=38151 RepID=A0A1B6E5A1_9HEMI